MQQLCSDFANQCNNRITDGITHKVILSPLIFRFIPDYLKKEDSEAGRKELTSVNSDIIQRLQIGEEKLPVSAVSGEKDTVSVGVGVVKPGTNIEEIIEAAWTIGKELEDSSKVRWGGGCGRSEGL